MSDKIIIPKHSNEKITLEIYPKIAIIILHKDKNDLIKNLLQSIYDVCTYDKNKMIIYIGDTGSNEENIKELENIIDDFVKKGLNIKLFKYKFYNFGQINNDIAFNKIDDDTNFIIFMNNDIELINDAITHVVNTYLQYPNAGTIGCRMHFKDGTIQHMGIWMEHNSTINLIKIGHIYYKENYNVIPNINHIITPIGNTGGFMGINKKLFTMFNGFNPYYEKCFEDVELNAALINADFINYNNLDGVCYHYEGSTRKDEILKTDYIRMEEFIILRCPNLIKKLHK